MTEALLIKNIETESFQLEIFQTQLNIMKAPEYLSAHLRHDMLNTVNAESIVRPEIETYYLQTVYTPFGMRQYLVRKDMQQIFTDLVHITESDVNAVVRKKTEELQNNLADQKLLLYHQSSRIEYYNNLPFWKRVFKKV